MLIAIVLIIVIGLAIWYVATRDDAEPATEPTPTSSLVSATETTTAVP